MVSGISSKQSKDDKSKWLETRVAERRVISEVSLFLPCCIINADHGVQHAKACKLWFNSRRETHVKLRKAM
jgi:hypothetical protein